MNDVTVILNQYKRPYLEEQYEAVAEQSVKPDDIMLWYNYPGDPKAINYNVTPKCVTALCNRNFGVWARFAFALMAKTKYVCIFDDDTIPGSRWIENCLQTIQTHRGLLGTRGVIFASNETYFRENGRIGWGGQGVPAYMNPQPIEVDLVGHSWFFEREWLSAYWREQPGRKYIYCGEDMHFSYSIQKYLGLGTYVPPHPPNDTSLWGSIKGNEYGGGMTSLWVSNPKIDLGNKMQDNHSMMDEYFRGLVAKGWKLLYQRT